MPKQLKRRILMANDKNLPKIMASKISKVKGKDFVNYDGKLDYAHQFGIKSLKVETLQIPSDANGQLCVCKAELQTEDGSTFVDIGDATPDNVPQGCVDSFMRVASTRAKSRVIEDAFNICSSLQDQLNSSEYGMPKAQAIDVDFTDITKDKTQCIQGKYDGGGTKPASEKQLNLIKSLASRQSLSASDLADNMFNKSIDELQGGEANQLIKRLKKDS